VHLPGIPPFPWVSTFPELNVRTYVTDGGKQGVWFYSLDAGNPVVVAAARRGYHLPYYHSRMSLVKSGRWIDYAIYRLHHGAAPAEFLGSYRPVGPVYHGEQGTLDYWLTERYCLYTVDDRGRLCRGEIDHDPWPLQPADAEIERNTMALPHGLHLPEVAPLLHFSRFQRAYVWPLEVA
jgi:uncharacterized protein YqjF (DUF2071 family)